MKSIKEALNIDQKWTPEQARNDIERYVLRGELPAVKSAALAVMALEKQTPKKLHGCYPIYFCPVCQKIAHIHLQGKYCPDCGQALNWGSDEGKIGENWIQEARNMWQDGTAKSNFEDEQEGRK